MSYQTTSIDMRSDTVTKPTPEMRKAIAEGRIKFRSVIASPRAKTDYVLIQIIVPFYIK